MNAAKMLGGDVLTKGEIVIDGTDNFQIWRLPEPLAKYPKTPTLNLDTGRSTNNGNKWAVFVNPQTLFVRKFPCNLNRKTNYIQPFASSNGLNDEYEADDETSIVFEVDGITYSAGHMAADEGGLTGLGQDKSVEIKPRIISGLILFGIEGPVNLSVSVTYQDAEHFNAQCDIIKEALSGTLSWGTSKGNYSVPVERLMVIPESSCGWRFPGIFSPGRRYPNFKGERQVIFDGGFQTLNMVCLNANGKFNQALSRSFKDFGASAFYAEIANRVGASNPESPELINAINSGKETFYLPEKRKKVALARAVADVKPVYEKLYLEKCLAAVPAGFTRVTLIGGIMHIFGDFLQQNLSEAFEEVVLAPKFPELAQIVSQAFEFTEKYAD